MNVAAEEVLGLMFFDKFAYSRGTGMKSRADLVQFGAKWRRMADEHERFELSKSFEPLGDLWFRVFARCIEGSGIGIAEACDVPLPGRKVAFVEIVQSVAGAHGDHIIRGFVVARQNVDFIPALLEDLAAAVDPTIPGHLVSSGNVAIGLDFEEAFQRFPIRVDVRKDQKSQSRMVESYGEKVKGGRAGISVSCRSNEPGTDPQMRRGHDEDSPWSRRRRSTEREFRGIRTPGGAR